MYQSGWYSHVWYTWHMPGIVSINMTLSLAILAIYIVSMSVHGYQYLDSSRVQIQSLGTKKQYTFWCKEMIEYKKKTKNERPSQLFEHCLLIQGLE